MSLTFIIVYLVLTVSLLSPLTVLSPPTVLTSTAPDCPHLATLSVPATPINATLQRTVAAVPSLLADAGSIDTLAVLLTAGVAEL